MIDKYYYRLIFLLCVLTLLGACAETLPPISKDFGQVKVARIEVPKYENYIINTCWELNLHPNDIVLNIDLCIGDFGHEKSVDFNYHQNTGILCLRVDLDAEHTITDKITKIDINISYLAYYKLRKEEKIREVYSLSFAKRNILYATSYNKADRNTYVNSGFNKWNLEKKAYNLLYWEIASIGDSNRRTLLKRLDEHFINRIKSKSIKYYVSTANLIMQNLQK